MMTGLKSIKLSEKIKTANSLIKMAHDHSEITRNIYGDLLALGKEVGSKQASEIANPDREGLLLKLGAERLVFDLLQLPSQMKCASAKLDAGTRNKIYEEIYKVGKIGCCLREYLKKNEKVAAEMVLINRDYLSKLLNDLIGGNV